MSDDGGLHENPGRTSDLGHVAERREYHFAGLHFSGRRRRPSGERPPLPRELQASGKFWLASGIFVLATWITLFAWPASTNWWTEQDLAVLNWLVDLRNDTLTTLSKAVHALGSFWFIRPLRWAILLVLVFYKRFRAVFGVLISVAVVEVVAELLAMAVGRIRPLVDIIGDWSGYAHPSRPVAGLAVTLALIGLALIPKGRWRHTWFIGAGAAVLALGLSRMYLGVDHPSDVWTAAIMGPAIPFVVFRLFVPEAVFPVRYSRGVTAHLDVTGERGLAIRTAVEEQLGLEVLDVQPFGLEGSGGSTPLRIKIAGNPDRHVFAKLYARSHLRADRWYKAGRTILYGSLEDEVRFQSVRRLVEYEDYMLLLLDRAGLPSPKTYGFVEITPEREYMIVTEFIEGAREMGDAEVTDEVIDDALSVVRKMWDAGLAHRDVKPANVLVQDGKVVLIDPAFATVRPSPWRQAVDLANMMLILGLKSTPERVYERALRFFTPDDLAEAFAAGQGITIPTQSRSMLSDLKKTTGVDLLGRFRSLAPPHESISIQRWSPRRIRLAAAALFGILVFISLVIDNVTGAGFL
jgi:tRNA A-37 threonylcarbamoyl transferase component Bud32/membrane-associated phospholipid phosphatase